MGEFNVAGSSFRVREIVLALVSVSAIVLCLVFLGLYATKGSGTGDDSNTPKSGVTDALRDSTPGATTTTNPSNTCNTPLCLETTANLYSLVNTSVDPCENFYAYACGKWPLRNQMEPDHSFNSVLHKIRHDNDLKIRRMFESESTRDVPWSAEKKAKNVYSACLNEFGRNMAGGNPFLSKVLQPMGGWYVLGNFQQGSWDLLANLEKVHVDHWTDVLFSVNVQTDRYDRSKRIIVLRSGGTTLSSYQYLSQYSYYNKTRQDYMVYMRKVGELLVRDSGMTISEADRNSRLDTYVSDVMEVETLIANLTRTSPYDYRSYDTSQRVQIKNIANLTSNTFNWVSLFRYMFTQDAVNENTYIVIPEKTYLRRMADDVKNMGADRNRKLNNYFTWRLVQHYISQLSSEYAQAGRQYMNDRYGRTEFPPAWEVCMDYVESTMKDALSHIFVGDHFADQNKKKVMEIARYVKQALIDSLTGDVYMDDATKAIAKDKAAAIVDKLGYPDYIGDKDKVDVIYASLDVHSTDHFQNALNLDKFQKILLTKDFVSDRYDKSRWPFAAYQASSGYIASWNELWISAGLLQFPIYYYGLSHYLTFGAIGSIMAQNYIRAVDRTGSRYNKYGKSVSTRIGRYTTWYSQSTYDNYTSRLSCISDQYTNKTVSYYIDRTTKQRVGVKATSYIARRFGGVITSEMWKLKVTMNAYQAWIKDNGPEPVAPSIGFTNQQMLFLAYAQSQCFQYSEGIAYYYGKYSWPTAEIKINGGVSNTQEFSDAFKCNVTSTLNQPMKCSMP